MDWLAQLFTTYGDNAVAGGLAAISTKAAIILSAALVATRLLRKSTASTRHHVWALALLAVLALPALSAALPVWQLPVLPAGPVGAALPGIEESGSRAHRSETSSSAAAPLPAPEVRRQGEKADASSVPAPMTTTGVDSDTALTAPAKEDALLSTVASYLTRHPGRVALALWGAGLTFFLVRLLLSCAAAVAVVRQATPASDGRLLAQADEVREQLKIRGDVKIMVSDRINMPMAWGIFRPTVLLPAAALQWAADKRFVVLLHEMGHLKRRDCQTLLLARVVAAVHWFNPLAWTATRCMQAERERACDDLVLSTGTAGPDYAQHLLDIARGMRTTSGPSWATVAMARPNELEGRLLAILDPTRRRGRATRRASVIAGGALGLLVLPLAAMQPSAVAQEPQRIDVNTHVQVQLNERFQTIIDQQLNVRERVNANVRMPIQVDVDPQVSVSLSDVRVPEERIAALAAEMAERMTTGVEWSAELNPAQQQRNERVVQAFLLAIQDEEADIRAQAAHSLGNIESAAAIDALSEVVVNDVDAEVRAQAAWALGMIEVADAVPALSSAMTDSEAEVREQVAWALGMIESVDAVPALAAAVNDSSEDVREQVAWALGMIESPDGVDALAAALGDESDDVREQAVWALGMIESPASVEALAAALRDESPDVREQAAWALGMIETSEAVDPLMETLRSDESWSVREQAAWALGMIEDEEALDALLDAMSDENLNVRKQALWAVSQISR